MVKVQVKKYTKREKILKTIQDFGIDLKSHGSDGRIFTHPAEYGTVVKCGQKLLELGLCKDGRVFLYTPQSGNMMTAYLEIEA